MNSYWQMPFRRSARVTMENLSSEKAVLYYQINYTLTELPDDAAYFHAQWRRTNPVPYMEALTIVDGVTGKGHYVGTYLAWQVNNNGWWGEGESKFYLDGDRNFPTICGTGTEDYFGGAWNWEQPLGTYRTYSTPYLGMHQVIKPAFRKRVSREVRQMRFLFDPGGGFVLVALTNRSALILRL